MENQFDLRSFEEQFHTDRPLGALWSPEGTVFRLWAPLAQSATLLLYEDGEGGEPLSEHFLEPEDKGVWTVTLPGDLHGVYYEYAVEVDETIRCAVDPYAKAVGLNGRRGMVIDLSRAAPEGWEADQAPPLPPETVIYEVHVKDFSFDPASGVEPALRGKYGALCLEGTTLNGDGEHPTGLSWLKGLGVTHVQLMPVFDFGSVDEGGPDSGYNWGYDPMNYNAPEGSYSADPRHGEVRVRELRQAVQALHRAGLRVVMDVVYNHTYSLDSPLWRTAPWYHYRRNGDGSPSNGSGCGNDIASERSMCARYILDSVLYWAETYHMDGFRFDLMGLLDVELMNRVQDELDRRYGVGEKLLLGEPWSAAGTAVREGTELAHRWNLWKLRPRFAAFCDATRDSIKGNLWSAENGGFVNGGGFNAGALEPCLKGWAGGYDRFSVRAPSQTVNYLSAHDDWTLWDKLVFTLDGEQKRFKEGTTELLRANRLAAAILFCCQGHLFLLAGEEFGRTKNGVKNSYNSPPELNMLDWERAWANRELADYYRGLIALRKQLPGLCDKSEGAGERFLKVRDWGKSCVSALVDNTGESPWEQLFLVFNAGGEDRTVTLPDGNWERLVNGRSSFLWKKPSPCEGAADVRAMTAGIFGRRGEDK